MMDIPTDATHEWTRAMDIGNIYQRRYYKFENNKWYSFSSIENKWFVTNNDEEWFANEIKEGYFKKLNG